MHIYVSRLASYADNFDLGPAVYTCKVDLLIEQGKLLRRGFLLNWMNIVMYIHTVQCRERL